MTIRIDDVVLDSDATKAAMSGTTGNLRLGGDGVDGDVLLFPSEGDLNQDASATFHLDANGGNLWMGGNGKDGDLVIHPSDSNDLYSTANATFHYDGDGGNLWMGGNGKDADLVMFPSGAPDNHVVGNATFHFDGDGGNLWMGGNGKDADLVMFPSNAPDNHVVGNATFHFDGNGGNLWMGGNGTDGDLVMFPSDATDNHDTAQATIHLDANAGDITLRNADCAEEFAVADAAEVLPGSVMVLDDDGLLQPSAGAYDRRVVGIVSGAGDYKPGLVLDRRVGEANRSPIAVMGKAFCRVTAEAAPIRVGDLLTTSDRQGYAMRADDPMQAFGAVIGKALASLDEGTGLVPVLVALQ